MTRQDLELFAALLRQRCGMMLTAGHAFLLESRLHPLARAAGMADVEALADHLRAGQVDEALAAAVTDAMTPKDTAFFRDHGAFERLRDTILPDLITARATARRLRVWSAGCASGQEPYSLAMLLHALAPLLKGWQVEILATDLSPAMVERTGAGLFTQVEVQRGLPIQQVVDHFIQVGARWQIGDDLRQMVSVAQHNLLDPAPALGSFDLILCRHVLSGMERAVHRPVLDHLTRQLSPGGVLLVGPGELPATLGASLSPLVAVSDAAVAAATPGGLAAHGAIAVAP